MSDQKTSFQLLKEEADELGVVYAANISEVKLSERVEAAKASLAESEDLDEDDVPEEEAPAPKSPRKNTATLAKAKEPEEVEDTRTEKQKVRDRALALVKIRLTPNGGLSDQQGATFQVANSVIDRLVRYVPFGADWCVEQIILDQIQEAQTMGFTSHQKGQQLIKKHIMRPTYTVQVYGAPTKEEIERLAIRQAQRSAVEE